jgi:hypothetical protein
MLSAPNPPLSIPLLHAKQYSKLTNTSNNAEYHVPKKFPINPALMPVNQMPIKIKN